MGEEQQKKPTKTAKRPTDLTNLQKAKDVKESGYATLVHASPHKDKIDDMLINKRWPPRVVVNELYKIDPDGKHPSYKSVENYRDKYIDAETAIRVGPDIKEKYIGAMGEFDVYLETLTLYKMTLEGVVRAMSSGMESQLGLPNENVTKRIAQVESLGQFVFKMETDLGLREKTPEQWKGTLTDEREHSNNTIGKNVTDLKGELERITGRIVELVGEEKGRGEQAGRGGDNRGGTEKPKPVHGGQPELPKQLAPSGVVSDTNREADTGQGDQKVEDPTKRSRDSQVDTHTGPEKPR